MTILVNVPTISLTDAGCLVVYDTLDWMGNIINIILGIIMIAWLHAMYQQSRKVLIFLVVIFLAIRIANAVMLAIETTQIAGEEYILSGTYQCTGYLGDYIFLVSVTWVLSTAWEVVVLCFTIWIAVKHFHELQQHSTSGIIGDCFTVLMQTHVSYVASFWLSLASRLDMYSLEYQIFIGITRILQTVQLFVLGPRLILGVREYHAELVANSDTASAMTSIAFQERVHVSTSSTAPMHRVPLAGPWLVDQVPKRIQGITRGNGEKCAGADGPTELVFVQFVVDSSSQDHNMSCHQENDHPRVQNSVQSIRASSLRESVQVAGSGQYMFTELRHPPFAQLNSVLVLFPRHAAPISDEFRVVDHWGFGMFHDDAVQPVEEQNEDSRYL
ncbi:hypothetical protein DFJ58DRAFT_848061 [Suillus subalutaceus]|uniref:uncharacterized protein n=1 Tax=Suillus subalutaceus TaxID=48586 RepID=UPI001B863225|nr:uncharacterized protein DFJ58DRAFT_848061 [Suillus subalutaceus]KAG1832288.1 hypothetical protein DFJ58DRAFT_848061 [Suillus subalutaceus]